MEWQVLFTDEFEAWWHSLSEEEQLSVDRIVKLLSEAGPALPHPYSSGIHTSTFSAMRELRIQHAGEPYRVLYLFDPERNAVLLIGGKKTVLSLIPSGILHKNVLCLIGNGVVISLEALFRESQTLIDTGVRISQS